MLRSQKRLLKEYLHKTDAAEDREKVVPDKKRLRKALEENKPLPDDLKNNIHLRQKLDLEDANTLNFDRDDEYRMAGRYEPRILITTSTSPSQPCIRFAKELKLLFPNSERINRGQTSEKDLVDLCRRDDITDLIEISGADGQGRPTMMRVCHFPFGPTAVFTLTDIVMRADLPEKPPHMTQAKPNLIFHRFETKTGKRICSILKHLFPIAGDKSCRVITFANVDDQVVVRQHVWKSNSTLRKFRQNDPALQDMTAAEKAKLMQRVEIDEIGPRFTLIPFKITRATLEDKVAEAEWNRSTFIRKAKAVLA